jgi:hypothetical protein
MKDFIKNLQFIFRPSFWLMLIPFNKQWDDKLNELLNNHKFTNIDHHNADLGNARIWIENYPYCCFWLRKGIQRYRPSRLTILRAKKILNESGGKPGKQDISNYERDLIASLK